jgi:hypothetical protein
MQEKLLSEKEKKENLKSLLTSTTEKKRTTEVKEDKDLQCVFEDWYNEQGL